MVDEILNEKDTKSTYDKEAYIKKKREQLDNAYKTIDTIIESPVFKISIIFFIYFKLAEKCLYNKLTISLNINPIKVKRHISKVVNNK